MIPTLSTGRARDVGHRAARIHNQGKLLWWCPDPKSRRIVPTLRNQSQSESQSQKNNRRDHDKISANERPMLREGSLPV